MMPTDVSVDQSIDLTKSSEETADMLVPRGQVKSECLFVNKSDFTDLFDEPSTPKQDPMFYIINVPDSPEVNSQSDHLLDITGPSEAESPLITSKLMKQSKLKMEPTAQLCQDTKAGQSKKSKDIKQKKEAVTSPPSVTMSPSVAPARHPTLVALAQLQRLPTVSRHITTCAKAQPLPRPTQHPPVTTPTENQTHTQSFPAASKCLAALTEPQSEVSVSRCSKAPTSQMVTSPTTTGQLTMPVSEACASQMVTSPTTTGQFTMPVSEAPGSQMVTSPSTTGQPTMPVTAEPQFLPPSSRYEGMPDSEVAETSQTNMRQQTMRSSQTGVTTPPLPTAPPSNQSRSKRPPPLILKAARPKPLPSAGRCPAAPTEPQSRASVTPCQPAPQQLLAGGTHEVLSPRCADSAVTMSPPKTNSSLPLATRMSVLQNLLARLEPASTPLRLQYDYRAGQIETNRFKELETASSHDVASINQAYDAQHDLLLIGLAGAARMLYKGTQYLSPSGTHKNSSSAGNESTPRNDWPSSQCNYPSSCRTEMLRGTYSGNSTSPEVSTLHGSNAGGFPVSPAGSTPTMLPHEPRTRYNQPGCTATNSNTGNYQTNYPVNPTDYVTNPVSGLTNYQTNGARYPPNQASYLPNSASLPSNSTNYPSNSASYPQSYSANRGIILRSQNDQASLYSNSECPCATHGHMPAGTAFPQRSTYNAGYNNNQQQQQQQQQQKYSDVCNGGSYLFQNAFPYNHASNQIQIQPHYPEINDVSNCNKYWTQNRGYNGSQYSQQYNTGYSAGYVNDVQHQYPKSFDPLSSQPYQHMGQSMFAQGTLVSNKRGWEEEYFSDTSKRIRR